MIANIISFDFAVTNCQLSKAESNRPQFAILTKEKQQIVWNCSKYLLKPVQTTQKLFR